MRPWGRPPGASRSIRTAGTRRPARSRRPAQASCAPPPPRWSGGRACRPGGSSRPSTSGRSAAPPSSGASQRYLLTAVAERRGHPEELVEELVDARQVRLAEEGGVVAERAVDVGEVHVPDDRDESELP